MSVPSHSIPASEARARLFPLIDEVNDDQSAVEITTRRGSAFLVSAAEYHSLRETVYLLSSATNASRLRTSLNQARTGQAEVREMLAE